MNSVPSYNLRPVHGRYNQTFHTLTAHARGNVVRDFQSTITLKTFSNRTE